MPDNAVANKDITTSKILSLCSMDTALGLKTVIGCQLPVFGQNQNLPRRPVLTDNRFII